jgi:glycine cleavage system regulatory protein
MTYDDNNSIANDHAAFRESIAVALAGGLSAAEQTAFDVHRAACANCAAEFDRARESENHMTALLAPALPAPGFEDRLIQQLRENAPSPRSRLRLPHPTWFHPALGKAVAGVAAAIVLGGVGYAVTGLLEEATPVNTASSARLFRSPTSQPSHDGTRWDISGRSERGRTELGISAGDGTDRQSRFGYATIDENKDAVTLNFGDSHAAAGANAAGAGPVVTGKPVDVNQSGGALDIEGTRVAGEGKNTANFGTGTQEGKSSSDDVAPTATSDARWFKPTQLGTDLYADGAVNVKRVRGEHESNKAPESAESLADVAPTQRLTALATTDAPAPAQAGVPIQSSPPPGPDSGEKAANDFGLGRPGVVGNGGQEPAAAEQTQRAIAQQRSAQSRERATTIADLQKQAERLTAAGRQDEAKGVIAQIQVLDPANQFANAAVRAEADPQTNAQATTQAAQRKVIRNGELSFEVDRFDSAFAQVSKLTTEAGGYVGTTSSEKLPNGKVQGKVTVRVPPDRLDTLVLQLRGIGDLRSQSLEAQDVSKKYTDLESQLRAARAMEERLIGIIKEGKGQIKDLLAAEKELGNWRTKVEELTGEMKYYDNLVSLATLNLTLTERDIETPATAYESENVDAGVESEDVEGARAAALKAIEEAKGRVVQSDLKRYDAGQFGATIVAEVPPDTAGPLLDRLKQIGKVARLDVQRKQTAEQKKSNAATHAPVRVEKRDTRFNLSIYNLANVAPRQTATLNLAADDVEKAYQTILDRVTKAGGRIVSSNLNRQKPEQTTGTIAFEVPTAQAEAVTNDLRAAGESMKLTVTENPDVQNATTAKRGYNVSLIATGAVAPRETTTIQIAATDVAQAREKILTVAGAQAAHVRASQLNENDRQNISAALELDVKRAALPAVEKSAR